MTVNAVDATGLSPTQINALAKQGVKYVGRYLSHNSWKGLSLGEVANIKAAGMDIFSIYETNPTTSAYFSSSMGKADALDAVALAKALGQPLGSVIYFTVDYDAQNADLAAILAYFQAVKSNLTGYKLGAYGSYTVLNYLHEHNAADYWFQTIAWSNGQRCNFLNLYQFQEDKVLAGVSVDFDNLEKADIGSWGQASPPVTNTIPPVKDTVPTKEWKIFQLTNPQYGLYSIPLTTWKCDSTPYKGWYFISTETEKDSQGNIWHHLFIGGNDYGWASQPLLTEISYKWGTINIDTDGYLHETFDAVCGTIPKGAKVAVIEDHADKCLVVSNNTPQWVQKNIVTE